MPCGPAFHTGNRSLGPWWSCFPGEVLAQWAMVMCVAAVMEGKVADWVTDLYSDHAGELGDIGLFLSALQERFENNA